MNLDGLSMFIIVLVALASVCIGAVTVLIFQRSKGGIARKNEDEDYKKQQEEKRKSELKQAQTVKLRDFLEFDTVDDDMIVQNDGTRYVMAIRCMGINYDLMSEPEMLAVEEGFANFLNTLKFPIQLYVQARSLDLTEGVNQYHSRLDELKMDCDKYIDAVNRAKATNMSLTSSQKQQMDYEIRKKRNLLEYGADIVNYIEKMSLNRNILQRKYYILVSYETAEMGMTTSFSKEEAKDVAYSELYTRCKTIQAAIMPCGIESTILKSEELAELLYIAYNKDDADMYDVKRAINSGFYRLYSTATSVREKKQLALEAKMQEDAIAQAELALKTAMDGLRNSTDVDISSLTEEEQYEDDTKKEAMQIILENQEQFDPQVVDMALEDLNASMHRPLVSQEELDAAEEEAIEDYEKAHGQNYEAENYAQGIDNLLNGSPVDQFLK
ncbi:MAG: hypothetical protein J6C46_04735 [Clostridia bacterium]|nr:hypothetical protein [Clostridia bacterium]